MIKPWVLDTGPLGRLVHPASNPEIVRWLEGELTRGIPVIIPEIADYELRRSLLLEGLTRSLHRLAQLETTLVYLPLTTAVMQHAAELWAETRRRGRPTADAQALDGDVILAAQTIAIGGRVATENVGHLSLFVEAYDWRESKQPV
jgi:predicted nucleic acid-binding protein